MNGAISSLLSSLALVTALVGAAIPAAQALQTAGPTRADSYINPDTGTVFENPDVDPGSECETPDREDSQALSDPGTANRNVHNDACLFAGKREGKVPFDGPATFESTGVGSISACPDPDLTALSNGPKIAKTHDHSGDGLADHCHMSGSQSKGIDGDDEYHARLNNTTNPGDQRVRFCYDPGHDGCSDGFVSNAILIHWV